ISARVADIEIGIELRAFCTTAAAPPALGGERPVFIREFEAFDFPVRPARLRGDLESSELVLIDLEPIRKNTELGPSMRGGVRFRRGSRRSGSVFGSRGRRRKALEARFDATVRPSRVRRLPVGAPEQLARSDVDLPVFAAARRGHVQITEPATEDIDGLRTELEARQGKNAGRLGGVELLLEGKPIVNVDRIDVAT